MPLKIKSADYGLAYPERYANGAINLRGFTNRQVPSGKIKTQIRPLWLHLRLSKNGNKKMWMMRLRAIVDNRLKNKKFIPLPGPRILTSAIAQVQLRQVAEEFNTGLSSKPRPVTETGNIRCLSNYLM